MDLDLASVRIQSIVSAEESILRSLVEISMKGNNFSLEDEEKYRETWNHFAKEFASFDANSEVFLVVEDQDRIVGFVRLCRKPGIPRQWWLLGLEVREEYRRRGIGTKLIEAALGEVRAHEGTSVLSVVHKANIASLIAHHKAGFQILTDRFERFDGTPSKHENYWLMRTDVPIDGREVRDGPPPKSVL